LGSWSSGELVKFVEVGACGWIICDCETSFFGFLFPLSADEFFDGPDKRVENSPFDLLEDIAYCSFIVELPREKNTECEGACQDRADRNRVIAISGELLIIFSSSLSPTTRNIRPRSQLSFFSIKHVVSCRSSDLSGPQESRCQRLCDFRGGQSIQESCSNE
jgi:hypothetical protein